MLSEKKASKYLFTCDLKHDVFQYNRNRLRLIQLPNDGGVASIDQKGNTHFIVFHIAYKISILFFTIWLIHRNPFALAHSAKIAGVTQSDFNGKTRTLQIITFYCEFISEVSTCAFCKCSNLMCLTVIWNRTCKEGKIWDNLMVSLTMLWWKNQIVKTSLKRNSTIFKS